VSFLEAVLAMTHDGWFVALLSAKGTRFAEIAAGASFFPGLVLGLIPMVTMARVGLLVGVPLIAGVVLAIANPGGGCNYDCVERAAWTVIVGAGLVAWFAGFIVGAVIGAAGSKSIR
jgi:hypothetical protein